MALSQDRRDDEDVLRRSFPRRLLRRGFRRWLQANIRALGAIAIGFCLLVVLATWIQRTAYARGLVQGALITTYVGSILVQFEYDWNGVNLWTAAVNFGDQFRWGTN